jgi:hypothetical protein
VPAFPEGETPVFAIVGLLAGDAAPANRGTNGFLGGGGVEGCRSRLGGDRDGMPRSLGFTSVRVFGGWTDASICNGLERGPGDLAACACARSRDSSDATLLSRCFFSACHFISSLNSTAAIRGFNALLGSTRSSPLGPNDCDMVVRTLTTDLIDRRRFEGPVSLPVRPLTGELATDAGFTRLGAGNTPVILLYIVPEATLSAPSLVVSTAVPVAGEGRGEAMSVCPPAAAFASCDCSCPIIFLDVLSSTPAAATSLFNRLLD